MYFLLNCLGHWIFSGCIEISSAFLFKIRFLETNPSPEKYKFKVVKVGELIKGHHVNDDHNFVVGEGKSR